MDKADANCTNAIRQLHIDISNLKTPKEYVETRKHDGMQYPAAEYMKAIEMKYFPTVNWTIEEKPIFNANKLVAWVVTGKLAWDYGYIELPNIGREGMMAAAHRVQYNKEKKEQLSDLGNDVKAANTDTWKKALNFYLNICDDIYKWETPELTPEQVNKMLVAASLLKDSERMEEIVQTVKGDNFLLNKKNFTKWLSKIEFESKHSQ